MYTNLFVSPYVQVRLVADEIHNKLSLDVDQNFYFYCENRVKIINSANFVCQTKVNKSLELYIKKSKTGFVFVSIKILIKYFH